jgi:hypothetical protein
MVAALLLGNYSFLPDQTLKISISSRGQIVVPTLQRQGSNGDPKMQEELNPTLIGKLNLISAKDHTRIQLEISRDQRSPLNRLLFAIMPSVEEKEMKLNKDGVVKDKLFVSGTYTFLEAKNSKPLFENWTGKDAGSLTGPLWVLPTMLSVPYRIWKNPSVEKPFEIFNDEGTSYQVVAKEDAFNSSDKSLRESYKKYTFRVVRIQSGSRQKYDNYVTGNVIFNKKTGSIYRLSADYNFADGPSSDYTPREEGVPFLRSVTVQISGEIDAVRD